MADFTISRATLGRVPLYLGCVRALKAAGESTVSSTAVARSLMLGEVQVRKDLNAISGSGKPKIGYVVSELASDLEALTSALAAGRAVVVGAGRLGCALLEYHGFADYGIEIAAAFDHNPDKCGRRVSEKSVYPMEELIPYCKANDILIGIVAVPEAAAQEVTDMLLSGGVAGIWNFAPRAIIVPEDVTVQQENLASSLAYLSLSVSRARSGRRREEP